MHTLRLAMRPWRQSPLQQAFMILGVGGALFFAGILNRIHADIAPVMERIQSDLLWTLYVKPDVAARDEAALVDTVRTTVGSSARRVELVTKEQFLERLAPKYPELAEEIAHLGTDLDTIVPRVITVEGRIGESALAQIRGLPTIEKVENSRDRFAQALQAFRSMSWLTRGLALGLVGLVFLLLWQGARVHAYVLKDAVGVLRQWGASAFGAALPEIFSSVMLGAAGGLVAAIGWMSLSGFVLGLLKTLAPALAMGQGGGADFETAALLLAVGAGLGLLSTLVAKLGMKRVPRGARA